MDSYFDVVAMSHGLVYFGVSVFIFLLIPKDMTRRKWIIVTWITVSMEDPSESQHVSALRPTLPMLIGVQPPSADRYC